MQNIVAAQATMKQGKRATLPSLSVGTDWTHQMLSKKQWSIPSRSEYRSIPIRNFLGKLIYGENKK
jgi:hypothetical protein